MIVLDTHVLFWWLGGKGDELSRRARTAIEGEDAEILVSSISAWEIALLVAAGRLMLSIDVGTWIETAAEVDRIRFVPVDNAIAVTSVTLPGPLHRDPADRMIVATARYHKAPLVTKDRRLQAYPHIRTIW